MLRVRGGRVLALKLAVKAGVCGGLRPSRSFTFVSYRSKTSPASMRRCQVSRVQKFLAMQKQDLQLAAIQAEISLILWQTHSAPLSEMQYTQVNQAGLITRFSDFGRQFTLPMLFGLLHPAPQSLPAPGI